VVAFIIFWSAVVCILFFLLGAFFKGLASMFNGFVVSMIEVLSLLVLGAFSFGVLTLIFMIAQAVGTGTMGNFWGMIVMLVFTLVFAIGLFGGLAAALLSLIGSVLMAVITWISVVLEVVAQWCENVYVKFLNIIINRFEKY
jgi:hypothetical protein